MPRKNRGQKRSINNGLRAPHVQEAKRRAGAVSAEEERGMQILIASFCTRLAHACKMPSWGGLRPPKTPPDSCHVGIYRLMACICQRFRVSRLLVCSAGR